MRLSTNTLLIVANPFAAPLSAEGRCTALCPADPAEGGGRYVGARTVAKTKAQPAGMRSPFGPRDKVSVSYDLRPVKVADTSYYRAALKSGDVLRANDSDPARPTFGPMGAEYVTMALRYAADRALAAFVADGGDRSKALAEWRKQGLASIADAIDPPQPDKLADPPNPDATATEGVVS